MGTWSTSITGNDTAMDLRTEYTAAFFKYDVPEALERIDKYVRKEMFDESDAEEWCNYYYSLADFMWKKGILTEEVRDKAIEMIDSGFGLELWAEEGEKTLKARQKALTQFKEKLLSPQPAKRKIKPNVHLEPIFNAGDIIAIQLQTAGKPYTEAEDYPLSEEEFHSFDGKYVLMQSLGCYSSWSSHIVPEIKDYWARFRLFDGIYDTVPTEVDISSLKDAQILEGSKLSSVFFCESSMFYFKKRNYSVISKDNRVPKTNPRRDCSIFWGINREHYNPDSLIIASMGKRIFVDNFDGTEALLNEICYNANRYGRRNYSLSQEENDAVFDSEFRIIIKHIKDTVNAGGKLLGLKYRRPIGVATVLKNKIDNIYILGKYQGNGFGTELVKQAVKIAGKNAYIDIPKDNKTLIDIARNVGLTEEKAIDANSVRMSKPSKILFGLFERKK